MNAIPDLPQPALARQRNRRRSAVVLAVVVVVLVGGVFIGRGLWWSLRPTPDFPSLATQPDSNLRGTVAFLRPYPDDGCIWIVKASGASVKKIACAAGAAGELKWLADGRIQSTRYKGGEGTGDTRSWIFDVASGRVQDVPLDQIPPPQQPPTVVIGPVGERVTSRSKHGQLTLTISDQAGTRELLTVGAPDTYTFGQPTWSPDGKWFIVKDDLDRLLLVTTGDPSLTRVLVDSGHTPAITANDVDFKRGG